MESLNPRTQLDTWAKNYFANSPSWDECYGFKGEVKHHWQTLLQNIDRLEPGELRNRQQELLKLLKENGVTYNVYGDTDGLNRPWLLDTMPLVISPAAWRITERGLKQRAYVLNKLLEDLYGDRKLLKDGIIPAELIYAHSGFLRPVTK